MTAAENLKRYTDDPWAFLCECVWTKNQVSTGESIQQFPSHWEYLRLYVRMWQKCRLIAVPKSRRMTMSWTNIALYLHAAMFKPGQDFAFVSKKEDDAAELVRRAEFIYDHIPEDKIPRELLPKKKTYAKPPQLIFPDIDSKIQGFPMGADQLRQFTFSGILGDECAFWEEARAFYSAAFPTIEGGGRMSLISSRSPGFFQRLVYDQLDNDDPIDETVTPIKQYPFSDDSVIIWQNPKNQFTVIDIHYTANPNKCEPGFKETVRASMPIKDFMVEYERSWQVFNGKPVYEDYSAARHESRERLEPHLGLPLLLGWDFGLCYDDKTEVLTESGWKLFKDIENDRVAVLNPETFELFYEYPKLKVDMPYSGKMLTSKNNSISMVITPDHTIPYWTPSNVFRRAFAKDLLVNPGHAKIRMTCNWNGRIFSNPLNLDHKVFCAFMGAYLSKGSVEKDRYRVQISQGKDRLWISEILKNTPWEWYESGKRFRCSDEKLSEYLSGFGTQKNRFIPPSIKNSSKENILEFIKAYTRGDGRIRIRKNGSEEHTIYSCSEQMAKDFQELALKVGWTSSVRRQNPRRSFFKKENRWIVSTGGWHIAFKKTADYGEIRNQVQGEIDYNGRVYCLSVSTGILCVRRDGRTHFNGNTPACVVAQLREGRLFVLKEYVAEHSGISKFCPMVMSDVRVRYPSWRDPRTDLRHYIDPAGFAEAQTDQKTCAGVMRECGLKNIYPGAIDFESRRKAVEHFLITHTRDGAGLQLYAPDCSTLSKGFAGGYQYPDKYADVEPGKPRPIKNSFSHPHDALQYVAGGALALTGVKSQHASIPTPSYSFAAERADKPSKASEYSISKNQLGGVNG